MPKLSKTLNDQTAKKFCQNFHRTIFIQHLPRLNLLQ